MNTFLQLSLVALFSWVSIRPVLVPIVFVKDMKSNLGEGGIRTHDLRIRSRTFYN